MSIRGYKSTSQIFSNLATPTLNASQLLLYFSASVSHILKLSHGRDKILGLIQNVADLYKQCMLEYLNFYTNREWPLALRNAHAIQTSMKTGRKFFRLLRWLEEMGRVEDKLQKSLTTAVLLKLVRHIAGVFYYLLDNIIWTVQIGIVKEFKDHSNWRLDSIKDALSLLRYILRIGIFLFTTHSKALKEKKLRLELLNYCPYKEIKMNSYPFILNCSMIKARSKRRFQAIEMMINVCRVIMLVKSLRLPGSDKISDVFYSVLGVTSGGLALFKLLTHKSSPLVTYNINNI